MIPISDTGDRRVHGFPIVNVGLIAACVLVFLYQVMLSTSGSACVAQMAGQRGAASAADCFTFIYGMVPVQITQGIDVPPANVWPAWTTIFTSMFMHGGWSHILGNMVYLWVFGDNIEDTLGHLGYLVFYLVCGVAAALAHTLSEPLSDIPTLGASGAISGVLGAYLVLFPRNQVNTVVFLGYFVRVVALPALVVLGFWIVLQVFNSATQQAGGDGVAYWAHIGGFAAGMLLIAPIALLRRNRRGPNRFY